MWQSYPIFSHTLSNSYGALASTAGSHPTQGTSAVWKVEAGVAWRGCQSLLPPRAPERQLFEEFGPPPEERFAIGFLRGKCLTKQIQTHTHTHTRTHTCKSQVSVQGKGLLGNLYTPDRTGRPAVPWPSVHRPHSLRRKNALAASGQDARVHSEVSI